MTVFHSTLENHDYSLANKTTCFWGLLQHLLRHNERSKNKVLL